jgi:hypothetical protein
MILDVGELSEPVSVQYIPEDLFSIFNFGLNFTETENGATDTGQIGFQYFWDIFETVRLAEEGGLPDYKAIQYLRRLMTIPILVFNNQYFQDTQYSPPPANSNRPASLVVPISQVPPLLNRVLTTKLVITPFTFWIFTIVAGFLILWSITLLALCSRVQVPNSSFFPEIDFATKCVKRDAQHDENPTVDGVLYPLSNTGSAQVRRRLVSKRFFVVSENLGSEAITSAGHIILSFSRFGQRLFEGKRYT